MLSIRLSRVGKRKQPHYRLIVCEKSRDPWGKSLEILGHYDPRTKAAGLNAERIKYWISKGAQATPTVHNLLVANKIVEGEKVRASKSLPGKKKRVAIEADKKAEAAKQAAQAAEAEKTQAAEEVVTPPTAEPVEAAAPAEVPAEKAE